MKVEVAYTDSALEDGRRIRKFKLKLLVILELVAIIGWGVLIVVDWSKDKQISVPSHILVLTYLISNTYLIYKVKREV